MLTEEKLLRGLRSRQSAALEAMIAQYNRYVATILTAVLGVNARKEDVEELSSDVFVAVWNHADALKPGKVKAYIGATARNTAKSFLRKKKHLPMDEDELTELADRFAWRSRIGKSFVGIITICSRLRRLRRRWEWVQAQCAPD